MLDNNNIKISLESYAYKVLQYWRFQYVVAMFVAIVLHTCGTNSTYSLRGKVIVEEWLTCWTITSEKASSISNRGIAFTIGLIPLGKV